MTRTLLTIIVSVLMVLLLATVLSPVATGQDAVPVISPAETAESSPTIELPVPAPSQPGTNVSDPIHDRQAVCPCHEQHWLVSVRHCQKQCAACAACCALDYFRADWDCCTTRVSQAEFVTGLRPGVPVCIVIHGSYVTVDSAKVDCRNTFRWLRDAAPDRPLHVVIFTWPSEGTFTLDPANAVTSPLPGIDVAILGRRAELNGVRLAALINQVPPSNPICLLGHSHGARIVTSALHLLAGGGVNGMWIAPGQPHRIRTVLAAAAIDHDWLSPNERYGSALCATECLLNIRSRQDWALWFYPLRKPFASRSLGRGGFSDRDLQRLGPHASQVAELDVTPLIGVGHIWPHYYARPEIAAAIVPYVYFTD